MRVPNPLKTKVEMLRVDEIPIIVRDHNERINAHNYAREFGYKIKTRERPFERGFEIYRTK